MSKEPTKPLKITMTLKDGRIVSVETTGELIRKTMKENKIRCKEAAVVVSSGI